MEQELHPNAGKNDIIEVDGVRYQRLPIKTHLITDKDNILDVAEKYGKPVLSKPGDVLFISGKVRGLHAAPRHSACGHQAAQAGL